MGGWGGTDVTASYVGMVVYQCSNVVECALLVCIFCQPAPPTFHPEISFRL